MGTYKVIQDIESEDKLLGPLTMRQFIYAIIVVVISFIAFRLALINPLLPIPFIPPILLFGLLASPFGHDQSSEVWLLAKIRFFLVPRRRIWDQNGIKQLVTITVPKRIEKQLTNNLSQTEVRSRLEALANTIDSRGWAVKNVNVNLFAQPSYVLGQVDSDRLIDATTLALSDTPSDIAATDDMLDNQNTRAQALDQMIASSTVSRKQQLIQTMQHPVQAQPQTTDYWFLNQGDPVQNAPTDPGLASFNQAQTVRPDNTSNTAQTGVAPSTDEQALLDKIHSDEAQLNTTNSHLKTLQPISESQVPSPKSSEKEKTNTANQEVANLANNNDLNVETIARQANKVRQMPPDDEVVISLH